jgi:hypothetical protein
MAENNKMPPDQDQRQRTPQGSDKSQKPAANPAKPNMNPNKPGIDPDRDRMGNNNPVSEPEEPEKIDLDEVDDDEAATQRVNRE